MAKQWSRVQGDLFEQSPRRSMSLSAAEREKVLEQRQLLLTEAMANGSVRPEAGDDQDHT